MEDRVVTKHSNITFFACVKCGIEKPHTPEYFGKTGAGGLRRACKLCRGGRSEGAYTPRQALLTEDEKRERNRIQCRDYHARNRDRLLAQMRQYRKDNADYFKEYDRERHRTERYAGSEYNKQAYAKQDKAKARADLERWKLENPEKARAIEVARNKRIKQQRLEDPEFREKMNKKSRDWQRNKRNNDPEYKEKAYAATREWMAANPEWVRADGRKKRLRRKDDPNYKIMASVRSRLIQALRGKRKGKRTTELLGAPIDVIRAHIEAQFVDDMTWDNWGRGWHGAREWHLDHIRPLSSFDLTNPDQLAEAAHYTNLQPLWAKDNLRKGAKP